MMWRLLPLLAGSRDRREGVRRCQASGKLVLRLMVGSRAGARIADSSALAICGVNLFQLRAGITESHDCLPGLRLSGNLGELQSSFNGSWRFLTDGGKTTSPRRLPETQKHGVWVETNIWTLQVFLSAAGLDMRTF